jgi:hypothetical protein
VRLAFFRGWLGDDLQKILLFYGEERHREGEGERECVCEISTRLHVYVKHQELYGRSYSRRKPF